MAKKITDMSKRSQIQMAESIAVIIIVIFLLVIGIVFWNSIRQDDIKTSSLEREDLSVIALAKVAAELPELRCYSSSTVSKVNCFDYHKILALNASMHSSDPVLRSQTFDYYNYYFRNSRITIQQVYPTEDSIVLYDNNISRQTSLQISIPIIIEKNYGKKSTRGFGLLIVEGYYR